MKTFKIMTRKEDNCTVTSVPFEYAEKFNAQALKNHSQSIEKLNERGGLSPSEFYCIAHSLSLRDLPKNDVAVKWLINEFGLLSQITQLKQQNEILIKALEMAANQLEGCALAVKTHGQNINVDFFIDHYEQSAKNAREALLKSKKP